MVHINLSQEIINKLAGYAIEITDYSDPQYRYDIGIWSDGSVSRGDLHISDSDYTRWHDAPAVSLCVHPIYTTEEIRNSLHDRVMLGELPHGADTAEIPQDELDVWADEARSAAKAWAREIAEQLASGIDTEAWEAPTPCINW